MIHYNPIISGSLIVSGTIQVIGGEISASVVSASYIDYNNIANKPTLLSGSSQLTSSYDERYVISGSITQTTWDNIASKPSGIVSSSIQVLGGTNIVSSSTQIKTLLPDGSVSGSIQVLGGTNIVSSSVQVKTLLPDGSVSGSTQILGLGFVTGSYVTINEYNYLTQSFNVISASVVNISNDIDAGVFATTGSNTFLGTQIITGSMYVTGDMIVQGSSSLQNITASAVSIGTNIVYLNTDTPAVRFAGLSVFDSGSTGATGSLFWDSENERWIYQKASGSSYSGGMLISGPRNLGALGDEVGMPTNKLIMGIGGDHISSSVIYHDNTTTSFPTNVEITGSLIISNAITSSIAATNGVVSGSSQITFSGISSLPTLVSGSSQITFSGISSLPTLVSGSSQVTLSSTTGYGSVLNQAVLTSSSPTFAGASLTGTITSNVTNNYGLVLNRAAVTNYNGMSLQTAGVAQWYVGMRENLSSNNYIIYNENGTDALTISKSNSNATFAGTITENSSLRYKENVETIKYGLDKVIQMRGVTYNKKDNGVKEVGVIAEEIYEVLPEVVLKNEAGEIDSVSYSRITAILIEAIKDLKKEIEDLKLNR